MKPTNPEEQLRLDQLLTDYAYGIQQYMKDIGCVREADNVDPVWVRTEDMCSAVGAPCSYWKSIRDRMLELDIPLALLPYGGYYLGYPGEQATLINHKTSMLNGVAHSCNEDIMTLARSTKTWAEIEEYAKNHRIELNAIPKVLRVLGHPLPAQIEILLLSAGKEPQ